MSRVILFLLFLGVSGEVFVQLLWDPPGFEFPQTIHIHHDELGWVMQPSHKGYMKGVAAKINAYGLRGDEFEVTKPNGVKRIMIIGDSNTFGYLVEDDDTYAVQLEHMLNTGTEQQYEVINTGHQRYNSFQQLKYLKLKGLPLKPDTVVVAYYPKGRLIEPDEWPQDFENAREKVMTELAAQYPTMMWLFKNSGLMSLIRDRAFRIKDAFKSLTRERPDPAKVKLSNERRDKQLREYLGEIKNLGERESFDVVVMYLPTSDEVREAKRDEAIFKSLTQITGEMGLQFVDSFPVMDQEYNRYNRDLFFTHNDHPNAYAHKKLAELLVDAVK